MSFKVTFNETDGVIETRVHGIFDWDLIEHMVPELGKFVIDKKCNLILLDFRDVKTPLTTLKIYETPQKIAYEFGLLGINALVLKRAVLLLEENRDFDFLEVVTVNNAQKMKIFTDEKLARQWLHG